MAVERLMIGLSVGRRAANVRAALVAASGRGEKMKFRVLNAGGAPVGAALRGRLRACESSCAAAETAAADLELGALLAEAATRLMKKANLAPDLVAAVGVRGAMLEGPLQADASRAAVEVGSPSLVARKTGVAVVGDFFRGDVAAGGLGRPLDAWPLWLLLRHKRLARVVVNLGAMAEVTFLGGGASATDVVAFDAGPGTILLDAVAESVLGRPMDADGASAAQGRSSGALLNELFAAEYFRRRPPKTTSPAEWGETYQYRLAATARKHRCEGVNLLATVTELTARGVAGAIAGLTERPHEVILAGGGARNIHLAARIRALLSPCSTVSMEKFGVGIEAVAPVCVAILAAARLEETPANCPLATGGRPAILGGVYLP
jgi:anhydro-N-acetylmuramic acid kinase